MHAVTEITPIALPKAEVFDFLANVENLPLWATRFCQSGRWDGERFKVGTAEGELIVRIDSDSRTGVIDRWTQRQDGVAALVLPLRVVDADIGQSAVRVDWAPAPGTPDEGFARQRLALREDLTRLAEVIMEQAFVW